MRIKQLLSFAAGILLCVGTAAAYTDKGSALVQGYSEKVAGPESGSASHVPGIKGAMIARPANETRPIEWKSATPASADKKTVTFAFIGAVSKTEADKPTSPFDLYMNGEKLMTFHVKNDKKWSQKGNKQSTLTFEEYDQDLSGNHQGYFFLTVPAEFAGSKAASFRLETTSPERTGNWVMIFKSPVENSLTADPAPAIPKDPKQKMKILYSHFGAPADVEVEFDGVKQKRKARFGLNTFELPVSPAQHTQTKTATVKSGEKILKTDINPVKQWKVNFVQHVHTDIGYTRPQHEILSEHIRFIDYALDYCDLTDGYPDDAKFRWTCEASWAVSEYIRTRPKAQVERLKQRIKEGRIEVTAMYFNFDELPGEQELAYSLYPLKEFKKEGIPVQTAMQNDVNGIAWSFSDFFPDLGVKYIVMGTHGHKALISFDKPTVFWWESPSGKKTLTYRSEHYMHGNFLGIEKDNFEELEKKLLDYLYSLEERDYPHDLIAVQFSGYFTDNSPPSTAAAEMARKWNDKYEFPKIRLAVASEFMEDIEKRYGNDLQTFRAAWPDWWTDGFGSGAREAAYMRYAEADIISNQISLSMAKLLGAEVPASVNQEIEETNKALLFYGEHTFGFHGSIWDPFGKETMEQRSHKAAYAWESYRRSRPIGETALGLLQTYAPRHKDKAGIMVFNPLNWEHSGVTTIYADHEILPINKKTIIRDEKGAIVPMQVIRSYSDATYWNLWVDGIPALGSKYYTIEIIDDQPQKWADSKDAVQTIENQWYRICLDMKKGTVSEWFDKELNKNLIASDSEWKMGELIYERDDKRGALDQFKPGNFERFSPSSIRYEGFQEGPIWDSYKFKGTSPAGMEDKDGNFTFELKLYKTSKQVDFTYRLKKKQETEPEAVYVSFPFELNQGKIYFDVPGGTIEAGVEQIPGSTNDWNTVQNFAAVRNGREQIVLGSQEIPLMQFGNINLGRFKAGATPESNQIFTWPMNNYWVTNFNADQHGEFEWTYYLTSSSDQSIQHATQFAWGNRIPLPNRVIPAGVSNSNKPLEGSILSLPSNVLLVNMVPVAGENALILQLREIGGKEAALNLASPYKQLQVKECNPLGEEQPTGSQVRVKAWENKFVKVQLK